MSQIIKSIFITLGIIYVATSCSIKQKKLEYFQTNKSTIYYAVKETHDYVFLSQIFFRDSCLNEILNGQSEFWEFSWMSQKVFITKQSGLIQNYNIISYDSTYISLVNDSIVVTTRDYIYDSVLSESRSNIFTETCAFDLVNDTLSIFIENIKRQFVVREFNECSLILKKL